MTAEELDALVSEAGYMAKVHRDLESWYTDLLDKENAASIADTTERLIAAIEHLSKVAKCSEVAALWIPPIDDEGIDYESLYADDG